MRSPDQTRPTANFRTSPVYYLVGHINEKILLDGKEPVVMIDGQAIRESHVMVAVTPFEDLVCMYDYIPNRQIWARNTALEDSYWGIGFDSYKIVFEEVDREVAHQHAQGMRNYNELIVNMTLKEIGTDFFRHEEVVSAL